MHAFTAYGSRPPPVNMTNKRKSNYAHGGGKRSKAFHDHNHDPSQAHVDPTSGQRGALPGLDDDAELSDELSNDAIAYLRSVR